MDKFEAYGFFGIIIDFIMKTKYNIFGDIMLINIENLKLLDIINGISIQQRIFKNRFSHAFVFKINGESVYEFENSSLLLKKDEMLFIPKDSSYCVKRISEKSEYVLINFDADIHSDAAKVYSLDKYSGLSYIYENLAKLWLFGAKTEKYKCYSVLYNILAFISAKEKLQYSYVEKFEKIEGVINYLHSNIFNYDLKVDDLHLLCNISDTYFRKIFKANFGVAPKEYIINKRLSRALSIIISGDYNSISEVALSVGYSDALYFSRIFSKKYGICPSEYMRRF